MNSGERLSGGPIIGFDSATGGVRYRIVAIQSSWHSEKKTITADYISALMDLLKSR
jgi:hypothetical protein